jgi:hypothetical protein
MLYNRYPPPHEKLDQKFNGAFLVSFPPEKKKLSFFGMCVCPHGRFWATWPILMKFGIKITYDIQGPPPPRLYFTNMTSTPILGPTSFPIEWVPGGFSLRVNRLGREFDNSSRSWGWVELYSYSTRMTSWSRQGHIYLRTISNNNMANARVCEGWSEALVPLTFRTLNVPWH